MRRIIVLRCLTVPGGPALIVPADGTVLLGRSTHCDLLVDHPSVSRRHAELSVNAGVVRVKDLASRNGTFVGDERLVGAAEVAADQRVRFGEVAFLVTAPDLEAEALESSVVPAPTPPAGVRQGATAAVDQLSEAQQRVFALLVGGLSEKLIAARLGLSRCTVHNHVGAIYKALGVHSRAELMALVLYDRKSGGPLAIPTAGEPVRRRLPPVGRGSGPRLYYLSPQDRDAYRDLRDRSDVTYSDEGGNA
jgi:DNA-binding CsgD family transcriptional regulator